MLKKILVSLLAAVILAVVGLGLLFRKEIQTLIAVKKVDDYGFYEMNFKADYGFDKFLETGVNNDQELVEYVSKQLLKGIPLAIDIPDLGCSTFNAINEKGDPIFGRNFDLGFSPSVLVRTAPETGYKSISMVNLEFLGYGENALDKISDRLFSLAAPYIPLDGVNEKGVAMGILLLHDAPTNQQTEKVDITSTTAIRLVLDKAANVDEAIELLKKYDMHDSAGVAYHYQITDASGKTVIVEYINNKMTILTPEDKYFGATNFYLTPGKKFNQGKGQDRYKKIMTTLKDKKGQLELADSMNLLKAVSTNKQEEDDATQWSGVYNNKKQTLDVAIGRQYNKIHHFSVE
ncbi:carcinine hydrolase/isopenicillin-N N-acyltransferase family protein [Vagococcus intermedius]|uniref:Linear amide C-N hydrolase n=1 Tax=Vagococcus intermedius TaxID=2991418 RepID=A0AAF0I5N0_9ENTE|nr:C45 family peptidase [Vagococcus intermedius]WEG73078.1 linear amide C-N hydrolase [Vagococcus intermedius]WEG75162.1 linear amide C-N hydrolase [Vagococcus intermedius]